VSSYRLWPTAPAPDFPGAKADPGNAGWQLDLSASYDNIGNVLVAQGNLPEALKSFHDEFAIRDRLVKSDPGNAGWQYDLGISNERIGDVLVAQGNLAEALKSYQAKQEIISRLAKADPGNSGWQRDLSVSYNKIGRAGGAGQSAGGAEIVPRRARHQRPSGEGRPRQRRLAARFCISNERIGDIHSRVGQDAEPSAHSNWH
jgi:tetratricopeptide (TPR) repeat protein